MKHSDKMADSMINLCRMLYLVLAFFSIGAHGQTSFTADPKMSNWQSKPVINYRAAVTQPLDEIRERTSATYYAKKYKAQGNSTDPNSFALRTSIACDVSCAYGALPVTLIAFAGERIDALEVLLTWETSSETNNAGFDIERAKTTTGFEKVGFLDGSGNTTSKKTYQFPDRNPSEEITYYRLKQIDYDGKFEYSRIIAIAGYKEVLSLISVPNPGSQTRSFLQIKGNDNTGKVQLTVFDIKGAMIYKNDHYALAGNRQIPLSSLPELATGLYVAKVVSSNQHSTVSFVVTER